MSTLPTSKSGHRVLRGTESIFESMAKLFDLGTLLFPIHSAKETSVTDVFVEVSQIHQDVLKRAIDLTNDASKKQLASAEA